MPAAHRAAGVQGGASFNGPAVAPSAAGTTSGSATGRRNSLVLSTQSIIYTAFLSLKVTDVVTTAGTATGIVIGAGGYVSAEQQIIPQQNDATPLVTLTLKIPVAQYGTTLAKLEKLGKHLSFSQHSVDVTQQVADVSSRVASAQLAIKQLRALLSKAGTVGELLQVQDEINSQEAALESLLAQQQALAHETSYATVTVELTGPHVMIVKKHKPHKGHGFGTGLRAGWHALGTVVTAVLTAIGAILPFLIPVALILGLGYGAWRRMRRRSTPAAEPPATAEQ